MAEKSGKTVVLALDGSDQAQYAFNWYFGHSHHPTDKLVCVHVAETPTMADYMVDYHGKHISQYREKWENCKKEAELLAGKYHTLLKHKHVTAQLQILGGQPGEAIIEAAEKNDADFIIIGSRGLNKYRRTVLGSVSDYVLHHAACPVAICRKND